MELVHNVYKQDWRIKWFQDQVNARFHQAEDGNKSTAPGEVQANPDAQEGRLLQRSYYATLNLKTLEDYIRRLKEFKESATRETYNTSDKF